MKKILILLILLLFPVLATASPFGLKMGMSIKEIEKVCTTKPVYVKDDIYLIKPKKNHPLFESYLVLVDNSKGLYQIRAVSSLVSTNRYGTELRNTFDDVKNRVSKTYGVPYVIDEVDSKSIYKENDEWLYALKEGARTLAAVWGRDEPLKDHVTLISLECNSDKGTLQKGYLILYYYFENANKIEDEQDSVF